MLKRLTGTVLMAAGELRAEAPETQRVRYAVMYGRKVSQQGECALQDIHLLGGWRVCSSFASRSTYFGQTSVQTANKRLAPVLARRYLDGEVLFNEPYRLRVQPGASTDLAVQLEMQAVAEADCLRLESLLPMATQPVSLHTPEEVAIAHLVAKATSEPVTVLFGRGQRLVAFVCEKGHVANRRTEAMPADEAARDTTLFRLSTAVSSGYVSPEADNAPKEVVLSIYMGELCAYALKGAAARDYASRELEKQIARCVTGGDALAHPEVFGLAHVPNRWNFLGPLQQQHARTWQMALPASALMGLVALGFAINVVADLANQPMSGSALAAKRQQTTAEHEALVKRIPDEKSLAAFKELSQLAQERHEQLRADRLLAWVSQQLPTGITITALQFYRADSGVVKGRSGTKNLGQDMLNKLKDIQPNIESKTEKKDPKSYEVVLALSLAGPYDVVETQAGEVIKNLSTKFNFEQSLLDFDATKNRAQLTSVLNTYAKEFQP